MPLVQRDHLGFRCIYHYIAHRPVVQLYHGLRHGLDSGVSVVIAHNSVRIMTRCLRLNWPKTNYMRTLYEPTHPRIWLQGSGGVSERNRFCRDTSRRINGGKSDTLAVDLQLEQRVPNRRLVLLCAQDACQLREALHAEAVLSPLSRSGQPI